MAGRYFSVAAGCLKPSVLEGNKIISLEANLGNFLL